MRRTTPLVSGCPVLALLAAAAVPLILSACGGGYGGGGGGSGGGMGCGGAYQPVCPAPMVTLTAPAAGAMESGTIALTATASASTAYGLTVSKVDFLIDGTLVGTATTSPYTVMWDSTTVTAGTHMVTGKVTDSANDTATTPAVSFTVPRVAPVSSFTVKSAIPEA